MNSLPNHVGVFDNTAIETKRLTEQAARDRERYERELVQNEARQREREQLDIDKARRRLPKPRTADEERVHKMRMDYKRMGIAVSF
jgi:hypothetical protein